MVILVCHDLSDCWLNAGKFLKEVSSSQGNRVVARIMDFTWVMLCAAFLWARVIFPIVNYWKEACLVVVWSKDNWYLRQWNGAGSIGVSCWVINVVMIFVVVNNALWVGDMVKFSRKGWGTRPSARTVQISREDGFVKECK